MQTNIEQRRTVRTDYFSQGVKIFCYRICRVLQQI